MSKKSTKKVAGAIKKKNSLRIRTLKLQAKKVEEELKSTRPEKSTQPKKQITTKNSYNNHMCNSCSIL